MYLVLRLAHLYTKLIDKALIFFKTMLLLQKIV